MSKQEKEKKHKGVNIPKESGFLTKHHKLVKFTHYSTMLVIAMAIFLCAPGLKKYSKDADGTNLVSVYMNGELVGTVEDTSRIDSIVTSARKRIARENTDLVLIKTDIVLRGSTEIFGTIDTDDVIEENIYNLMLENAVHTKESAYEVKINKYTVNLKTADEVIALLEAAKNKYDTEEAYSVGLLLDPTRELDVLTTEMIKNDEKAEEDENDSGSENVMPSAGFSQKFEQFYKEANEYEKIDFTNGIKSIDFNENIEVVKTYVEKEKISSLEDAIADITKEEEKSKTYTVESGDTISQVANKNNITIDDLIAMNPDTLKNENSMLRIGQVLKVTSPEPELSVLVTKEAAYDEYFDDEIQVIENDDWYTNQEVVLQEPQQGFRKVIADVTYKNDDKINTNIIYENVIKKAIPKIVERGTKTPPTFIYPLSGRLSSGFGKRKAPKKGASTYHKGLDFAVPTGTAVRATCGGVVTRAGWGSGYGYCVYIRHPDGKESRYGHCSKVLVKAGQSVKQGEKIALSGNTGVSTGPHLHFEILVGGSQVNPLKYLN